MIRTSEVLKDDWGRAAAVSLVALPFGVLSSFCLLGVIVLAWGFDVLVRAHLGAALRLTRREPPPELARNSSNPRGAYQRKVLKTMLCFS